MKFRELKLRRDRACPICGDSPTMKELIDSIALAMKFRELKLRRDLACPICGDRPTIKELIDGDPFCSLLPACAAAAVPQANSVPAKSPCGT